ncbi:MAG: hypothetical protein CFE37_10635 [Alphaproteobacteria bacterium PA4]|nr:MAG: hypothetical protein CFE37_10635 [Alphaproteobacteria bacterium PA4]
MTEVGTATNVAYSGAGDIIVATVAQNIHYQSRAIIGDTPSNGQTVSFVRTAPGSLVAASVWVGTGAPGLANQLEQTFHAKSAGVTLDPTGVTEMQRLAVERAQRVLKTAPGSAYSHDVAAARFALAVAAMELLAVEAASMKPGTVDAKALRAIQRRQRPSLPR